MKEYVTGLQHIGIPTRDFAATLAFYGSIGFETTYVTKNGEDDVAFLQIGNLVIETYTAPSPVGIPGAIDHIAIDVTDIDKAFAAAKAGGYKLLDQEIVFLPFFDNGVKYFMIEGPNGEKVEFNQKL